jgi:predicted DNA binding CopG/RHH family protein
MKGGMIMNTRIKNFKKLVSEIDISKYSQEEYKQKVDMMYKWRSENSEQIPVRVSCYTKNKIEIAAKKMGINVSDFIRNGLEYYLKHVDTE